NELGLAPGEKAALWYFDESPRKGEAPNDWRVAGTGTVSADGRTIVADPGVGIPKFCCGAAFYDSMASANNLTPGPTTQAGLAARIPLAITRSYRSGDTNAGVFGLGTMMGYEEYLRVTSAAVLTYVYHGDARTDFVRQPDGTFTNSTVPAFRGTTITRNADDTRTMRDKHGRTVRFTSASFGVAVPTAMV